MVINFNEKQFPKQLKEIKKPPNKIEVIGNIKLLEVPGIAIIGSRNCTEYGKKMATLFAEKLSQLGINIISGMAIGVDSYAHIGAINCNGKTIAVLPCGINKIYPKENLGLFKKILESGGAIISEYNENEEVSKRKYLERNRIVSGLSIGVLVIEGAFRSGTSVTAKITMENNKPVFCVPSSLDNKKGYTPNRLIQKGAILVMNEMDIIDKFIDLKLSNVKFIKNSNKILPEVNTQNLNNSENVKSIKDIEKTDSNASKKCVNMKYSDIYKLITNKPIHINDIIKLSKKPVDEVNYMLMMLELEGNIISLAGKNFIRS